MDFGEGVNNVTCKQKQNGGRRRRVAWCFEDGFGLPEMFGWLNGSRRQVTCGLYMNTPPAVRQDLHLMT